MCLCAATSPPAEVVQFHKQHFSQVYNVVLDSLTQFDYESRKGIVAMFRSANCWVLMLSWRSLPVPRPSDPAGGSRGGALGAGAAHRRCVGAHTEAMANALAWYVWQLDLGGCVGSAWTLSGPTVTSALIAWCFYTVPTGQLACRLLNYGNRIEIRRRGLTVLLKLLDYLGMNADTAQLDLLTEAIDFWPFCDPM